MPNDARRPAPIRPYDEVCPPAPLALCDEARPRAPGRPRAAGPGAAPARARAPRRRAGRRRDRGLSLIEILLVVSLMGIIGAAIVAPLLKTGEGAKVKLAVSGARQMHASAEQWAITHGEGECPTVARLVADDVVSETASTDDPWGKPYRIACEAGKVRVYSSGPDRRENTADDIRMPAARVASGE